MKFNPECLRRLPDGGWFQRSAPTPGRDDDDHGYTRETWFSPYANRYLFDQLCYDGDDWHQYDTDQDAWYFGVWVNSVERQVVTYAEGDLSVYTYDTQQGFKAELARMADFYGPPPTTMTVLTETGAVGFVPTRPTGDIEADALRFTTSEALSVALS